MVICFSASDGAKRALDALVESGQFRDVSDAISMALVNYHVIQHEVGQTGHVLVETPRIANGAASVSQDATNSATGTREKTPVHGQPTVPDLFTLSSTALDPAAVISAPEASTASPHAPPKDWLWGQYNRFLPAKVTCRALARLLVENPNGVLVDDAASRISYTACGLGDFLSALDARRFNSRERALAAAFPTSAISGGQGRLRFGNQFVGTLKQGKLTGLPASLRLIGCDYAKEPRIFLTRAGADFAAIENPILDSEREFAVRTLAETEVQFLLGHVVKHVPEEASALVSIIDGIEAGAKTPDELDAYLRERFHLGADGGMTPAFLSTQRTGAVSRMVELGLIARDKVGLHVTYVVTHPGKCFRNQLN